MGRPKLSEMVPIQFSPSVPVWDRQPGEPSTWYNRFTNYFRPLGPERSLAESWRWWKDEEGLMSIGKALPPTWTAMCKKWRWRERAVAWDDHQRMLNMAEEEKARAEANKRYIGHALKMQTLGMQKVERMLEKFQSDPETADRMASEDARKLVQTGVQIEKEARGIPTWVVQIMSMDNDELTKRYAQLLAEVGGHGRLGKETGRRSDDDTDDSEEY